MESSAAPREKSMANEWRFSYSPRDNLLFSSSSSKEGFWRHLFANQLRDVDLPGLVIIITVHNFRKSFHVAKIQESSTVHFVLGSLYWSKRWWHAFSIPTVPSSEALALVLSWHYEEILCCFDVRATHSKRKSLRCEKQSAFLRPNKGSKKAFFFRSKSRSNYLCFKKSNQMSRK